MNDIPPASSKLRSLRVERGDDDTRFFADIESIVNILDRDGSNDEVALGEAFCTYGHCSSRAVVDAEFSLEAFLFKVTHRNFKPRAEFRKFPDGIKAAGCNFTQLLAARKGEICARPA